MIEQILYINLDRRTDRNEWFLKEMEAANVPMDIVERIPGKDWRNYSNCETLLEAIQGDGFALEATKQDAHPRLQGTWVCSWAYCLALQKIIESQKTTLLIQDDIGLAVPWADFLKKFETLTEIKDLWVIQLEWVDVPDARPNICVPFNSEWMHGIRGVSDRAVVYTYWGAVRMLGFMQGCMHLLIPPEEVLYYHFNNYNSFHPLVVEHFVKHSPHRTPSDVNPTMNEDMLLDKKIELQPVDSAQSVDNEALTVKWHRHDETRRFPKEYTRRAFLYSTPVLREKLTDYFDYPTRNELGISLSLGFMPSAPIHYPELLSKQICWFVKHLCEKTDMVEEGVSLRLGITDDMGDAVMPYLDACNFPMERVDWLKNREDKLRRASKIDAMRHNSFGGVARVLHMDINFLIGSHPTQRHTPIFSRILELWKDVPTASTGSILQPKDSYFFTDVRKRLTDMRKINEWPTVLKELAAFCNHSEADELDYWDNADPVYLFRGGIFGMNRQLLDSEPFWKDIEYLMKLIMSDEIALSVYARAKGWEMEREVTNIDNAFNWQEGRKAELYTEAAFVPAISENTDAELWLARHIQYYPPGIIESLELRPEDLI